MSPVETTIEKPAIKDLLSCKIQIAIWEQLYFKKESRQFAAISIRREDLAVCYLILSLDCKNVSKIQISQKAFEALSIRQPSATLPGVETFALNQFIPEIEPANQITVETNRSCKVCGCTQLDACYHEEQGNCWWVQPDLCSHCHFWPGESQRWSTVMLDTDKRSKIIVTEAINK